MKKKIFSLIFTAVFLLACLVPAAGLILTGGAKAGANEILAPEPKLRGADGRLNGRFLAQLADYVDDRFFLRQECVTAWAALNAAVFRTSVTSDVVLGREGWLYFAPTLDDYTRADPMTGRELWCAGRTLYLLQEHAISRGARFLFTVAPNKNSLYPENMPAYDRRDAVSNAGALQAVLEDMGVAYLDLFDVFRASDETLYFPTDSHWNGRGAALAADAILGALGRESSYFFGGFLPGEHTGDLYEMLYPAGTKKDLDWIYAPGYTFTANSANPDSITLRTGCAAGEGTLLMYRDSFGRNLYPYLAESFETAVFSRKNDYTPTELSPGDVMVVELVERNLRYLNVYAPTLPAAARDASLADGAVGAGTEQLDISIDDNKNYVNYSGRFDGCLPDDDSPVYVMVGDALYEAIPQPSGFSLWLSGQDADGPVQVIFTSEGNLVSLSGVR